MTDNTLQTKMVDPDDEGSGVATPTGSQPQGFPEEPASNTENSPPGREEDEIQAFSSSLASIMDSSLKLTESRDSHRHDHNASSLAGHIVLPLPAASTSMANAYVLPDLNGEEPLVDICDLPPEVTRADISIAKDNTFIETSSPEAAREIKKRFDKFIGVSVAVRSPYAITAFVSQHGTKKYRVGARDMSAPAERTAGEAEARSMRANSTSVESTQSGTLSQPRRRSRMSVHSFLPPVMFNKTGNGQPPLKLPENPSGNRSPPVRKLRKTRSIPNLGGSPIPTPSATPVQATMPTGRPHAHSVSSVDAFRPPQFIPANPAAPAPSHDTFADVMAWNSVPPSPLSSGSALRSSRSFCSPERPVDQFGEESLPDIIRHPFGHGVKFDTPSWHSSSSLLPPPVLREMQSFDSVLTARADPRPPSARTGKLRARLSDESVQEERPSSQPATPIIPEPQFEPLAETAVHSRYSTDLFDVLQNYRGLPRLDTITSLSDPPTIRLSLKADESAAPRDDPRFVIWGEVQSDEGDESSPSRSTAELSSAPSGSSRGKNMRERHSVSGIEAPLLKVPSPVEPSKRVVVAATIERWIAQLTSELNYDELLIFFLTYRTYISAVDLAHLLICRFHWALAQPTSVQDETVRRIVRVRTFIAIRYWFLTFFAIDFVPNKALRELFADWLNALRKDPILRRHKDAMSIVQKLRKVALDCKDAYTQPKSPDQPKTRPKTTLTPGPLGDLTNGNFAEALRKAVAPDEDTDIDLTLDSSETAGGDFALNTSQPARNPASAVDLAMLRQPLHLAFLQHGHGRPNSTVPSAAAVPTLPLPVPHSTISRVVVNAIGRLGRWKRVLNYKTTNARTPLRPPLGLGNVCVDVSPFDIEASETGDLLMVRGGVESYLKLVEASQKSGATAIAITPHIVNSVPPYDASARSSVITANQSQQESNVEPEVLEPVPETADESVAESVVEDVAAEDVPRADMDAEVKPPVDHSDTRSSMQSSVRFSVQSDSSAPSNRRWQPSRWQMDVVSIDDLDLSDLSSTEDLHVPAPTNALRRLPRRLPNRREFEFVRHSMDTVSSMGIRNHDSVLSNSSSLPSSTNVSGHADIAGPIQQWQMNALVDSLSDDEETGDVEAALRRLEGQISQDKQRAKLTKVDGWVQSIRERLANGQFGADRRRYSSDEEDYGEVQSSLTGNGENSSEIAPNGSTSRTSTSQMSSRSSIISAFRHSVRSNPEEHKAPAVPPGLRSPPSTANGKPSESRVVDGKPPPEDVVPPEILQSRVPSRPTTAGGTTASPPLETPPPLPLTKPVTTMEQSSFVKERNLKRHRSFILAFKSETLVQHFSMIDRDLFMGLKFEDVVSHDWRSSSENFNILDWGQFLRDRAKMIKENADAPRLSTLTILRCRFNLVANFVVSEIVLTHPTERLMTHSKFIRIAWKAYLMRNFHTLVAVLAGLDSHWVKRALRQSHAKIGIWENRMLRDLQQWASSEDDFKYIRHTVEALAETKSTAGTSEASNLSTDGQSSNPRSRAASELKPPPPAGCIPFFGVYLSELNRYNDLPDLIDPTAPNEPVVIDPETNTFEAPAHPEVFSDLMPLPPSVQLEPLINVHKQRLVAGVVKSLVAGQHLASKVQYDVASDRRLTQKCLKIRCLDPETLQRALALYSSYEN